MLIVIYVDPLEIERKRKTLLPVLKAAKNLLTTRSNVEWIMII